MAITKAEITKAIHHGVRTASDSYWWWSAGKLSLADSPEYLVTVEVARNIYDKLGESESLRLEMQYAKVLAGAGIQGRGAPLKAIGGGNKADLVLLKDLNKPTCVIEVKKNPNYGGLQTDLRRLQDVVYAGRRYRGLLKHGFLSICLSGDADSVNYKIESATDTINVFFERSKRARAKCPSIRKWKPDKDASIVDASIVVEITPPKK